MRVRDEEGLEPAKRVGFALLERLPPDRKLLKAALYSQIVHFYTQQGELVTAEGYSRLCVQLYARWELASLQLFHVLVNQDRWQEAVEESARFLELKYSSEYDEMFIPGYESSLDAPTRKLMARVRVLLRRHHSRN